MPLVHHPTAPDMSYEVPESVLDQWLDAGWIPDKTHEVSPSPAKPPKKTR